MNQELLKNILSLSEKDRIKLIGLIHSSLDSEIEDVDKAWAQESEFRLDKYYSTDIKTKSIADLKQIHKVF